MRIAALYDVHGNLPALEAVLAELDRDPPDEIVCGGDVAAGPMPAECLAALRESGARFVRGNADRELSGWPAERLTGEERAFLRALPTTDTLLVAGLGDVVFCHGSPRRDDEILTRLTPDGVIAEALGEPAALVVCGHTHVQFDRRIGERRLVNAGSVGIPYEGRRGAFWASIGPEIDLRHTEYDTDSAVAAIRATGYPDAEQLGAWLLEPVDPDEASRFFEEQARGA